MGNLYKKNMKKILGRADVDNSLDDNNIIQKDELDTVFDGSFGGGGAGGNGNMSLVSSADGSLYEAGINKLGGSGVTNSLCIGVGASVAHYPTGGSSQTAIGYIAYSWGNLSTSVGSAAYAYGDKTVALGCSAITGNGAAWPSVDSTIGDSAIAIGFAAYAGEDRAIAIGSLAAATAVDSICIGDRAETTSSTHTASIIIGRNADSTAANQLVIGSATAPISSAYIGNGATATTPAGFTFSGTEAAAGQTNKAGGGIILSAGRGTGSAAGAQIIIQTPTATGAGTTQQTATQRALFDDSTIIIGSSDDEAITLGSSSGCAIGFFGTTPAARTSAYSVVNGADRRSFDTTTVTLPQLAEIVGTLIADYQGYGLLQ